MANICNDKTIFEPLVQYFQENPAVQNNTISSDLDEAKKLYTNAKFYYSTNELQGALVSYSCCAVLLNSIVRQLPEGSEQKTSTSEILNCCLRAVYILQEKTRTSKPKNDEEKKDWKKICTNLQPLVFSKGSSDCLFFSSVAGLKKEKELFRTSLIYPLMYPNLYPKASRGILIYGPPGTGKTYIVKAAVNELQKTDKSVGVLFFAPSPGDLKGKYVGETEKKIEEWFTCASRAACSSQLDCNNDKKYISLIFMDEFDAIGPDRSTDTTGLAANSVNTLLQMMDGINSKQNVTVVAATNYPWNLDSAILRRFDTQILIDLPNEGDILELLNIELKRMIRFKEIKNKDAFCLSEITKEKKLAESDESSNKLSCTIECVEERPTDLTTTKPYNQLYFDYYEDINNNGGFVSGLVQKLKADNFSNSDISRLLKAAATYTGQLCIKSNLFYSSKLLSDYRMDEKFISCITQMKNEEVFVTESIKILKAYLNPSTVPFPSEIYQINKPNIVLLKYNNDTYINSKCFLYKNNDIIIDDPLIKDVFIKFDVSNLSNILDSTRFSEAVQSYKNQVVSNTKLDVVITFDFSIKQNSSSYEIDMILPISRELINKVFKPIYESFMVVKSTIEELNQANKVKTSDEILEKILKIEEDEKTVQKINTAFDNAIGFYMKQRQIDRTKLLKQLQDQEAEITRLKFENLKQKVVNKALNFGQNLVNPQQPPVGPQGNPQQLQVGPQGNPQQPPVGPQGNNPQNPQQPPVGPQGNNPQQPPVGPQGNNPQQPPVGPQGNNPQQPPVGPQGNNPPQAPVGPQGNNPPQPQPQPQQQQQQQQVLPQVPAGPQGIIPPNQQQGNTQRQLRRTKSVGGGIGDTWAEKNYGLNAADIENIMKDNLFDIKGQKDFFTDTLKKILNPQNQQIILDYANKDFDNLELNDYNFYNYLILFSIIRNYNNENADKKINIIKTYGDDTNIINNINFYLSSFEDYRNISLTERNIEKEIRETNGQSNIDSFTLLNTYTNTELVFIFDKLTNVFLISFDQYTSLIPTFNILNFNLFSEKSIANKNIYISINVDLFVILFKNSININQIKSVYYTKTKKNLEKRQFNPSKDYKNGNQYLIQLYINDVINFYNLSHNLYNDKAEDITITEQILNNYLLGFLNLKEINTISLCELICMRLHNNFDFVCFGKRFVLNKDKINYDELWSGRMVNQPKPTPQPLPEPDDEDDEFEDANEAPPGVIGGKHIKSNNKTMSNKIKSKFKNHNNTTVKNFSKNKSQIKKPKKIYHGGADPTSEEKELVSFLGFCNGNLDDVDISETILNKTIFIKTIYNTEEIKLLRKSGVLNSIWYGGKDVLKKAKNLFSGKTAEEIKAEKMREKNKLLEDLKQKRQYLPLLFKKINAIGFLKSTENNIDKSQATDGDINDDNDILAIKDINEIKIEWSDLNETSVKGLYGALNGIKEGLDTVVKAGLLGGVAGLGGYSTYNIGLWLLSKIGYAPLSAGAGAAAAVEAAAEATEAASQVGLLIEEEVCPVPSAAAAVFSGANFQALAIAAAVVYAATDIYQFATAENIDKGYIINSMFLNLVFTKITDIRYIITDNLKGSSTNLFINNIEKDLNNVNFIINLTNKVLFSQGHASNKSPFLNDVTLYKTKAVEPENIKDKLTNLNIPLQSFAYALTTVKTTYVKETGDLLRKYYDNKDKFMEEYKKKQKK